MTLKLGRWASHGATGNGQAAKTRNDINVIEMETIDEELEGTATYTKMGESERGDFQFGSAEKGGKKQMSGLSLTESSHNQNYGVPIIFSPESLKSPFEQREKKEKNDDNSSNVISTGIMPLLPSSMKKGVSMIGAKTAAPVLLHKMHKNISVRNLRKSITFEPL